MTMIGVVLDGGWRRGLATLLAGWLVAGAAAESSAQNPATSGTTTAPAGENDPAARFRGPLAYDFGVTNVQWEAATPEYSFVTFDIYWSYSWRAKWTEPAATSATGRDTEVENWDAAWVFVKFLPEKDAPEAQERNHWLHATLDPASVSHVVPAGATNFVKLSDDGARGMGVFLYRDAVGHGVNDWKKIKLRWNHPPATGADRDALFDPAKAAVRVFALPMVYIPGGAFKVGSGNPSGVFSKFADGPDMPMVHCMNNIRSPNQEMGGLTDGSWRGGSSIPFLLDAAWNAPVKEGTRARRFGIAPGELWGTHTYWEVNLGNVSVGGSGVLSDEYPTGYESFYGMKHDLTQGQYVDFLNSLPPDVAAERAFVGSEVSSDAGLHKTKATVIAGPGREPMEVQEFGGCTIYSSVDAPMKVNATHAEESLVSDDEKKKNREIDGMIGDAFEDTKTRNVNKKKKALGGAAEGRPVYGARLPFRRLPGPTASDTIAYAVWAGLRPMSQLESIKAAIGVRDPLAPPDSMPPKDLGASAVLLDEGLPTERYLKGRHVFGSSMATRAGCRFTPTSDRGTALATYWGLAELEGPVIPVASRGFRGSHGNGHTARGVPGGPVKRVVGKFKEKPADWPEWWAYLGGHFAELKCRLVISAENRVRKLAAEPSVAAVAPVKMPALPIPPQDARQEEFPRVTNIRINAGKKSSTVLFDLAWNNSWRAKWTEPAEKNCTGKPLTLESWDAVWVFVKFRPKGALTFAHALLDPEAAEHDKPSAAALEVGLSNDGKQGIGVFLYRRDVGQGDIAFKGVKLRWQHGEAPIDATTAEIRVHAIPMVYVPEGPFRSKSPVIYYVSKNGLWSRDAFVCPLLTIATPDASQANGCSNLATNRPRVSADWPNGYGAFYCMKYSISQGEYARFLSEVAPDPAKATYNNGQYGYAPGNAYRRYAPGLYGLCGYTIRYSSGEMRYEADVPDRPANFISDADINSFVAWAGLRPLTCLEYEKACRGARAVAKEEEAWATGACSPAAGLAQAVSSIGGYAVPATGRLAWPGLSYWGIRDLSQSGAVIEWPAVVIEDGREFVPNHGVGTPEPPHGWVFTSRGEWCAMGMWQGFPLSQIGVWLLPEDITSMPGDIGTYISSRVGRYGARGVRTAANRTAADAPLQLAPLPDLSGYDVALVNFAGQYKNDADQPVSLTLDAPIPAESFAFGLTSRTFTAAAKAVTPFQVPVVLTRAFAQGAIRGGGSLRLPVQLRRGNGEVAAENQLVFAREALAGRPAAFVSLDGGQIELRLTNATAQQAALAFELPASPELRVDGTRRSTTLAAGADGQVCFPIGRQNFRREGACTLPYRVTVGSAVVSAETTVAVANIERWWMIVRAKGGPKMTSGGGGGGGALDMEGAGEVAGLEGLFSANAAEAFALAAPGKGWKVVTNAAGAVDLAQAGSLPTRESLAVAVTRAFAAADADAALKVSVPQIPKEVKGLPYFVRVYVNEIPVFDSSLPPKDQNKPCRMLKGGNTVVMEWHSGEFAESRGGVVGLQFNDALTGKPLSEYFLDMSRK